MLFNSVDFVLFFVVVYAIYRRLGHSLQNIWLLAASYFFYGSWDWRFLFLLWASTIIDFYCGYKVAEAAPGRSKKAWLILSIAVNLSILVFFKYFNFFTESLQAFSLWWGVPISLWTLKVILPVGVSFYTFQSISYIVDVYTGKTQPEKKFLDYALFVAFFPQLVAGPIERAHHMLPQYKTPRVITADKNREGAWFIFWGFFLKIFLADNMARIVGLALNQNTPAGIEVMLGAYAFAFQIFGDFAGYSFIAMGTARLLGIDLMTNFLFPYFVTNPSAFWRNWHISLSSWLRDYLYIPLGGNRHGTLNTNRNLMITMFLGGLWHGAAWTFGLWGIYQGTALVIHRIWSERRRKMDTPSPLWTMFKIFVMFHVTCVGWLIFRAKDVGQLSQWFGALFFNFGGFSLKAHYLAGQLIFFAAVVFVIQVIQKSRNDLMAIPKLPAFVPWVFYLVMFYLMVLWGEYGGKEFIYFQF